MVLILSQNTQKLLLAVSVEQIFSARVTTTHRHTEFTSGVDLKRWGDGFYLRLFFLDPRPQVVWQCSLEEYCFSLHVLLPEAKTRLYNPKTFFLQKCPPTFFWDSSVSNHTDPKVTKKMQMKLSQINRLVLNYYIDIT